MTRTRHVLVTGGAGFLGSHLVERLLQDGDRVTVLDDLSTGDRANLRGVEGHPRLDVVVGDVRTASDLAVDAVAHLACPASPLHYQRDPMRTLDVLTVGTRRMVDLAAAHRASLLLASSSEVYGDPAVHPQVESYRGAVATQGPRACYDEGKRVAETLCFDYHRANGVDVRVVRIFNTYGPRMHPFDGRVVSNFILQALRGENITLYGDGSQTRSFCYVDDLIDGFLAMMNGPDDFHGPVNLGNPGEFTIKQLAEKVIELTDSSSDIVYLPLPSDDPLKRKPDISLAKEKLGWEPKVPLEDGLAKTVAYFRSLDLRRFRKPTDHTAHKSSDAATRGA